MITFDITSIFKLFETPSSQIYRHLLSEQQIQPANAKKIIIDFPCNKCGTMSKLQANFEKGIPFDKGTTPFPDDNIFICPKCSSRHDLSPLRMQIESQTKKKSFRSLAMKKRTYDFTILFEEMDKLSDEGLGRITEEDIAENNEINILREIVLDVQTPGKVCLVTT